MTPLNDCAACPIIQDNQRRFEDEQHATNERIFAKLDQISAKQNWMMGGLAVFCVLISIAVGLLNGYFVPSHTAQAQVQQQTKHK